MASQSLVQQLSKGIASAIRSTNFCVSGSLPNISPGIEVAGLGPQRLPLRPAAAKRLMEACIQAPYGKGTKTLVDKKVRDTYELAPKQFTMTNPEWDEAIRAATRTAAEQLGLPPDSLEPQLYKLLLYRKGGFFLPHRDSEKSNRMVASLIAVLPTPFDGGSLTVRHQASSQRIDFELAAAGKEPQFAAFYADCEHEVDRVSNGFRLCLAYNLVLQPSKPAKTATKPGAEETPAMELAQSISNWIAAEPAEPLVFALDHHYTQKGLSLDLLKGNDRATADLILAAAEQADCHAFLCQVSRHISQEADDGSSWERRWHYSDERPKKLRLGEIYEDDLLGQEWFDTAGKKKSFPSIPFSPAAIVASTPLNDWAPTREDYEGYTGNAGNTLDRWYHRSALCVWHRGQHYGVLAQGGVNYALELLDSMVTKLAKTPKKRLDAARADCVQLARAIVPQWQRPYHYYDVPKLRGKQDHPSFPHLLVEIDDPQTASLFLERAGQEDRHVDLSELIVAQCRTHGIAMFADVLTKLLESNAEELCVRDFVWLDKLASKRLKDPAADELLGKLVRLAAARFCRPLSSRYYHREDPSHAESTLAPLVRTLLITGDDETLGQVIDFVTASPTRFPLDAVQVPALTTVVTWQRKKKTPVHPRLQKWLGSVQQELMAATAQEPQPPADWARPAEIGCSCQLCKQLGAILVDPTSETGRISARESDRDHVLHEIRKSQCDVKHTLDKARSPYTLVLTKTNGSFERRVKRYLADQKLLQTVEKLLQ